MSTYGLWLSAAGMVALVLAFRVSAEPYVDPIVTLVGSIFVGVAGYGALLMVMDRGSVIEALDLFPGRRRLGS